MTATLHPVARSSRTSCQNIQELLCLHVPRASRQRTTLDNAATVSIAHLSGRLQYVCSGVYERYTVWSTVAPSTNVLIPINQFRVDATLSQPLLVLHRHIGSCRTVRADDALSRLEFGPNPLSVPTDDKLPLGHAAASSIPVTGLDDDVNRALGDSPRLILSSA
jgi:hypothetical protein